MKVTCIKCGKEYISMGFYFVENYKDKPEEYVCMGCHAKESKGEA